MGDDSEVCNQAKFIYSKTVDGFVLLNLVA